MGEMCLCHTVIPLPRDQVIYEKPGNPFHNDSIIKLECRTTAEVIVDNECIIRIDWMQIIFVT